MDGYGAPGRRLQTGGMAGNLERAGMKSDLENDEQKGSRASVR
jgi:hypothetical protein